MSPFDAARVHTATAAWLHVPEGSREVATPEYRLVELPSWAAGGAVLMWLGPLRRTVRQVVEEVVEIALGMSTDHLTWRVRPGHPEEFEREIAQRGGVLVDEVQVMAAHVVDALRALEPPQEVHVDVVDGIDDLRAATDIGALAFDTPPLDDDELVDALRADTEMPEAAWFLARRLPDGVPVGSAGATLDDDVVRLWGAAVHPDARGRGVHRALLAARLHHARLLDADLALAKGRLGAAASGLRRCGFADVGVERDYRLALR